MTTPTPEPGGLRRVSDDMDTQGEWWDSGLSMVVSILAFFAVPAGRDVLPGGGRSRR